MTVGLTYGVIPITAPQRIALSQDERNLVKQLENANTEDVRRYIRLHEKSFLKLFSVINDSIKLVSKTYMQYGRNVDL